VNRDGCSVVAGDSAYYWFCVIDVVVAVGEEVVDEIE